MIEYATETEHRSVMAYTTIHDHNGMTQWLSYRVSAIMTTRAIIRNATVVYEGRDKPACGVTGPAITIGWCG